MVAKWIRGVVGLLAVLMMATVVRGQITQRVYLPAVATATDRAPQCDTQDRTRIKTSWRVARWCEGDEVVSVDSWTEAGNAKYILWFQSPEPLVERNAPIAWSALVPIDQVDDGAPISGSASGTSGAAGSVMAESAFSGNVIPMEHVTFTVDGVEVTSEEAIAAAESGIKVVLAFAPAAAALFVVPPLAIAVGVLVLVGIGVVVITTYLNDNPGFVDRISDVFNPNSLEEPVWDPDDLDEAIATGKVEPGPISHEIHWLEGPQERVDYRMARLFFFANSNFPRPPRCWFLEGSRPEWGTTAIGWRPGTLGPTSRWPVFFFNRKDPDRSSIVPKRDPGNKFTEQGWQELNPEDQRCREALDIFRALYEYFFRDGPPPPGAI